MFEMFVVCIVMVAIPAVIGINAYNDERNRRERANAHKVWADRNRDNLKAVGIYV